MDILVVDDNSEVVEALSVFLKSMGLNVYTALTAETGLKQFLSINPKITLLDINLPDRSGMELLKEFKTVSPSAAVIMITGYKDAEKVIDCFREGAVDCILKPFNFSYVQKLITSIAGTRS